MNHAESEKKTWVETLGQQLFEDRIVFLARAQCRILESDGFGLLGSLQARGQSQGSSVL